MCSSIGHSAAMRRGEPEGHLLPFRRASPWCAKLSWLTSTRTPVHSRQHAVIPHPRGCVLQCDSATGLRRTQASLQGLS